ncbi:MAG: dTMP kinase [Dehalococcoidia bacterium]
MGIFVVFEGGEGVGKSTQARLLYRRLLRAGYPAIFTHEPGGTPTGERVRRWLKSGAHLSPLAELFLFEAARAQLACEVLLPALERGDSVVCDRFTASTLAYQGYARGLDLELVYRLNREASGGREPDIFVLLDLPVEVGLARKPRHQADAFQRESVVFHQRVRRAFLEMAQRDPERWLVVDGTRPRQQIADEVWEWVKALLESQG